MTAEPRSAADRNPVRAGRLGRRTPAEPPSSLRPPSTPPRNPHLVSGAVPGPALTCLVEGTRVLTERGEAPVETLRAGDVLLTMHHGPGRIPLHRCWRVRIDLAALANPESLAPVLIRAGALMQGAPLRDLRVSPAQGIFLQGGLVPARLLVNGCNIVQELGRRDVTYHALWLQRHDLLVADGALTESAFDDGLPRVAQQGGKVEPIFAARPVGRCAPLLDDGPRLLAALLQVGSRVED